MARLVSRTKDLLHRKGNSNPISTYLRTFYYAHNINLNDVVSEVGINHHHTHRFYHGGHVRKGAIGAGINRQHVFGWIESNSWGSPLFQQVTHRVHHIATSTVKDQSDPFSLVADELSLLANRLRSMVVSEVPKLASAAEYFFKMGVEGKRFRPTVLLLMATALNMPVSFSSANRLSPARVVDTLATELSPDGAVGTLVTELRTRQQCIAEITEMIHVASLLHDDVLDDAETRRGIGSLNSVMGNKVVSLLAKVVEHLVTGETMQMTTSSEQRLSMNYYLEKTYYKTASLISNSCKAIALLAGQTAEVATLAYEYGKNLGLAYQLIDDVLDFTGTSASLGKGSLSDIRHGIVTAPLLFAIEEFPQLREVVQRGFKDPADVDIALEYLGKSEGLQRAKDLAAKHASLAAEAIDSLPENDDEEVRRSRRALIDLTQIVITRTK